MTDERAVSATNDGNVAEIVADLLDGALELVKPSVLLMDREFDTKGVRDVCEQSSVTYLTPGRRTGERGRMDRLADGG